MLSVRCASQFVGDLTRMNFQTRSNTVDDINIIIQDRNGVKALEAAKA